MAKAETLTDNFSVISNTKWGGYGANPSVSGGELRITPTGSYPTLYSMANYDLTSSHVMVKLVQTPNTGNGSTSVSLNVQVSSGNTEEISWANGLLVLREQVSGSNSDISIAYDATNHLWLRIRESSGTVYWETSPDSLNWTTRRSKVSGIGTLSSVSVNLFAGYWNTEPSPGTAIFDNLNILEPPSHLTSWITGALPMGGATDGGTVLTRNYFDTANWLWDAIPASPQLHSNSSTWAGYLSQGGSQHSALLYDFGVKIVPTTAIDGSTPKYDVQFSNVPAWGTDPFGAYTVPFPANTPVPPGSDGHVVVADPTSGQVFGIWQAHYDSMTSTWSASWGGMTSLHGNGIDTSGSATATGLSRLAGVVGAAEFASAIAANSGLSHALFAASNITSSSFVTPAIKSDGTNTGGVATPIPQGTRFFLDPTIDIDAISGINDGEKVIAKTLQTHGAYIGDKNDIVGAANLGFIFEYADNTYPGAIYAAAGLGWDYYDMSHIPWASLRFLNSWNGS